MTTTTDTTIANADNAELMAAVLKVRAEIKLDAKNPVSIVQYAVIHNLLNDVQSKMYDAVKALPLEAIASSLATKELIAIAVAHHKTASAVNHLEVFLARSDVQEALRLARAATEQLNLLVANYNTANGASLIPAEFDPPVSKQRTRNYIKRDLNALVQLALDTDPDARLRYHYKDNKALWIDDVGLREAIVEENQNGTMVKMTRYQYFDTSKSGGTWVDIGTLSSRCKAVVNAGRVQRKDGAKPADVNIWDNVKLSYHDGTETTDAPQMLTLGAFWDRYNPGNESETVTAD